MSNFYGDSSTVQELIPFPIRENVDNVSVAKVEFATSTTQEGKTYNTININYKRDSKDSTAMLEQKVFKIDPSAEYYQGDETKIAKAFSEFNTMLLHIATKFGVTKEEFDKETRSASFEEFGVKYAALCNKYNKGQKMWMKIVKNSGGYPAVPRYPQFLQLMEPGVPCDLAYTNYERDQLEKQKNAATVNNGTVIQNASETTVDDVMKI